MIRIQNGQTGGVEVGGRTPRRTDRQAAPDRLAFLHKGSGPGLPPNSPKRFRALGYLRVSTAEQGDSGLGLTSQRRSIEQAADARGWQLTVRQDVASGKTTRNRPALAACLDDLAQGRADALIVAKLDRLIRSVADFAAIVEAAKRQGWALVALDLNVDTSTPQGEFMANVMASMAQFERRLIGQRTKDALAVAKAEGPKPGKLAVGRPRVISGGVVTAVLCRRQEGESIRKIARRYSLAPSTVQGILDRPGSYSAQVV